MKKLLIKIRALTKLSVIIFISVFLIFSAVMIIYKPIYSVYFKGEQIGYCKDKSQLQSDITNYSESGDENTKSDNLAFISIEELPTYKMCLLKRDVVTNDNEILETVKKTGIPYYKYYAILDDDEEILYVSDFDQAEEIIKKLKDKDSNNIDDISIAEKYETSLEDFTSVDKAVSKLYESKPIVVAKKTYKTTKVSTSRSLSNAKVSLGISLIRPVSGTISSRFGSISRIRSGAHTGLDIATSYGTSIKAAADGVVSFSGTKGAYGKMVAINHGNGVLTYYGHCSKLYASVGDVVKQGDKIAAVGSTGNSTGNHLHFEIRVNGTAYNPQNYVY